MSCHPGIKWAQRKDRVYLTVELAGAKDVKVNLAPEGVFLFSATVGQHAYDLRLDLADKVDMNEIKINIGGRSTFCILKKAVPNWWNQLLIGDVKTPPYVKVDWDKWVDEADEAVHLHKWVYEDGEAGPSDPVLKAFRKFAELGLQEKAVEQNIC